MLRTPYIHAHLVFVVENLEFSCQGHQRKLVEHFEHWLQRYFMKLRWDHLHPGCRLHIHKIDNIERPLAYANKGAAGLGLNGFDIILPALRGRSHINS